MITPSKVSMNLDRLAVQEAYFENGKQLSEIKKPGSSKIKKKRQSATAASNGSTQSNFNQVKLQQQ
jgi:hypothetical protein